MVKAPHLLDNQLHPVLSIVDFDVKQALRSGLTLYVHQRIGVGCRTMM